MRAPTRLRHHVGGIVVRRRLWEPDQRVLVAVSGGLDSMALLDLLVATQRWHGGRLEVGTVDHGVHAESGAHADHVQEVVRRLGLPHHRFALELGPGASEVRCREARYAALESVGADRIALAHHRDDQAETLLLQLLRGTGTRGLAAAAMRRDRLVRPLLGVGRDEIRRYARARGLSWCEDPTNADPRYLRNRVRAEVVPLLEALRPGASRTLARAARLAAADADLLDVLAAADPAARPGTDGWSRAWMLATPEPLVRRAVTRALPGCTAAHLDALLDLVRAGRGTLSLPGGRRVRVTGDRVVTDRV